jgi:hypothetical protein
MNWIERLKKRSTTEMTDRQNKVKIAKQIQKEIQKLRNEYGKMELHPCHGDVDLMKRDMHLDSLKDQIYTLEKERDTYLYTWANGT